jgi:hypothetical protein
MGNYCESPCYKNCINKINMKNQSNLKTKLSRDLSRLRMFDNNQDTNILLFLVIAVFIIASFMVVITYN